MALAWAMPLTETSCSKAASSPVRRDHLERLGLQLADCPVEVLDVFLDGLAHGIAEARDLVERMAAVLLLGPHRRQRRHMARKGPELENLPSRRLPGLELHSPHELEQRERVRLVRLRSLHLRPGEVLGGAWIGHHHFDALGGLQGDRRIEV